MSHSKQTAPWPDPINETAPLRVFFLATGEAQSVYPVGLQLRNGVWRLIVRDGGGGYGAYEISHAVLLSGEPCGEAPC